MPDNFQKLIQLFGDFPGVGPKQAGRFVYFLLNKNNGFVNELLDSIAEIKKQTARCAECYRLYFSPASRENKLCDICDNVNRDRSILLVVAKDVDVDAVEKTGTYAGRYFVLGGQLPILDKEPAKRIRLKELNERVAREANQELTEVILALNANSEGDYTTDYLKEKLTASRSDGRLKITVLGRGLSTGTELEYSDSDTITSALKSRF